MRHERSPPFTRFFHERPWVFDNDGAPQRSNFITKREPFTAAWAAFILRACAKINRWTAPTHGRLFPELQVLSDARDKSVTAPYGPQGTAGGFEVKARSGMTIDFIFISEQVKVSRHGVLSDSFNLYYPSDHLPVLAEVQI